MTTTTGPRYVADMLRAYEVQHLFLVPQMRLDA